MYFPSLPALPLLTNSDKDGGVKAKPLDLGEPKITFGAPFSHEVLEWCYNKALDTKALYMAAHGAFKNLSEVTLRRKDRVAMWKSGQVPGLVHDYQVCPQPGMVWIPQIGQVCFESCVGADTQRARSVLDEAMKLVCGRDLVLAYGVLPNDHKALVVEFAADADAESVAVRLQYRQVLLDLLQWQTRLLRGEVVVLDECLRGILGARLQAGARAPRGAPEAASPVLVPRQPAPCRGSKRGHHGGGPAGGGHAVRQRPGQRRKGPPRSAVHVCRDDRPPGDSAGGGAAGHGQGQGEAVCAPASCGCGRRVRPRASSRTWSTSSSSLFGRTKCPTP